MPNKPFLKWVGGKRWFVQSHSQLLPKKFNRYIEPFLGSAAVFFYLRPNQSILGDSNKDLIQTYEAIKDDWQLVYRYLLEHQRKHSSDYYYEIRKVRPRSKFSSAARFIYLNRTCWNGVYRVNKKGQFNVPIGDRTSIIFSDDDFESISKALRNSQLYACDFEELVNMADDGDLLFVDPPYTIRHNNNGFVKYNEKIFSWSDQERLASSLQSARERGALIVSTNAFHESVQDLYKGHFEMLSVERNSSISSKPKSRNRFQELVVLSE